MTSGASRNPFPNSVKCFPASRRAPRAQLCHQFIAASYRGQRRRSAACLVFCVPLSPICRLIAERADSRETGIRFPGGSSAEPVSRFSGELAPEVSAARPSRKLRTRLFSGAYGACPPVASKDQIHPSRLRRRTRNRSRKAPGWLDRNGITASRGSTHSWQSCRALISGGTCRATL